MPNVLLLCLRLQKLFEKPYLINTPLFYCTQDNGIVFSFVLLVLQNMYAQLLPLALPAPPMPGMGSGPGMTAPFTAPPPMGGMGMPPMPMPPFGMPPMGTY